MSAQEGLSVKDEIELEMAVMTLEGIASQLRRAAPLISLTTTQERMVKEADAIDTVLPHLPKRGETQGQIEWLTDLNETLLDGKIDVAVDIINSAIKMLERENA